MIVIHRTLKIILAIAIGSMSLTSAQTASASEIASIEQSTVSHNGSLSESVKEVPGDLLQSRDTGLILNQVPNQTPPFST